LGADRGAPPTHITTFRSLLVSQDSHAVFGREQAKRGFGHRGLCE
jgi:hypothetical protein